MFTRKLNSHKKPVGKAVLTGFKLEFNEAMNAATAGNAKNYVGGLGVDRTRQEDDQEDISIRSRSACSTAIAITP